MTRSLLTIVGLAVAIPLAGAPVPTHLMPKDPPLAFPTCVGTKWVYDHNFFILLNVAVGGGWPGNPDSSSVFPQTMLVDYVRVYKR